MHNVSHVCLFFFLWTDVCIQCISSDAGVRRFPVYYERVRAHLALRTNFHFVWMQCCIIVCHDINVMHHSLGGGSAPTSARICMCSSNHNRKHQFSFSIVSFGLRMIKESRQCFRLIVPYRCVCFAQKIVTRHVAAAPKPNAKFQWNFNARWMRQT